MIEASLILGVLLLAQVFGPANLPFLFVFGAIVVLCVPIIRLAIMKAPPFVPTPKKDVRAMIELAHIRPGERAYDLGCGDGRVVRAAAAEGAIATGFELSAPTFLLAKALSIGKKNVRFHYANFWTQDYRDADIIFCFLLKAAMREFKAKIWPQLKPGARVVSYTFRLPDIEPEATRGAVYAYAKR
jgi:SAM-dependent methyltransferase